MTTEADERDKFGYWRLDTNTCDLCDEPITEADRSQAIPKANFGSEDDEIDAQEAIDAIIEAIAGTGNYYDERLIDALTDNQGYCAHQRCIDQTSLYVGNMGGER